MKIGLKVLLVFLTLILCLNVSFAELCCYDGESSDTIKPSFYETCGSEEIAVGNFADNPRCSYPSLKRGCSVNGQCYETVFGNYIYDFPEVLNYFANYLNVDLSVHCDSLVDFNPSSCSGNYYNPGIIIDVNPDDTGGSRGGTHEGDPIDTGNYSAAEDLHQESEDKIFCADTGGPYGFFLSQSECNALTNDNGKTYPCLYNPYLAGYLKVSSSENPFGMLDAEAGCMAKALIKSCMDYKTEENCNSNPVYADPQYRKSNLKSCRWVPVDDYYSQFSVDAGICVSDAVDPDKHFNLEQYSSRQNLIRNPSFEKGDTSWVGEFTVVGDYISAYDGFRSAKIAKGDFISQDVHNLDRDVAYKISFAVRQNKNFTNADRITLYISEYDDIHSNPINTHVENFILGDFNLHPGAFKRAVFPSHVTAKNVSALTIKIDSNTDIEIDAVSFEKYDKNSILADEGVYKPLEIISSEASSCELCFDERNLNFCTADKSELLGDCSYMVENIATSYESALPDYLGRLENNYLQNWTSQSIANSLLFCEMYLNKNQCEDSDNFVNSVYGPLHHMSDSTLCKWSDTYGCFKDSDSSLGPDTTEGGKVYINAMKPDNLNQFGWTSAWFANYSYEKDSSTKSDYQLACDVMPPHVYMYFAGQNSSLETEVVTEDFPSHTLGNVGFFLEMYDVGLETCKNFDIEKNLYVDYIVNSETFYRLAPYSYVEEQSNIKDYFTKDGVSLLDDGVNEVTVYVKDQSGNIGKPRTFIMDVDLSGPGITVIDPPEGFMPTLGPNDKTIEVDVTDYSTIKECSFSLDPSKVVESNKKIDSSYYDAYGNLSDYSETYSITGGVKYMFDVPIHKTTINENVYKLYITCEDIFGQQTQEMIPIYADFNTDFLIVEPKSFGGHELDYGYLQGAVELHAVSTDKGLQSCEFVFGSADGTGEFDPLIDVVDGFKIDGRSENFYKNITATLNFNSDGKKEFQVKCVDVLGNEIFKNLTYYYDTEAPLLSDYSILDNSINSQTVVESDGKFYVRSVDGFSLMNIINASVDGTGTWPSNDNIDMKYYNDVAGAYDGIVNNIRYSDFDLTNVSFTGDIDIAGYSNLIAYVGEEVSENLYKQRYNLQFEDKAGNIGSGEIEVYFDASSPGYTFHSPVYEFDGVLYTNQSDPQIPVSFNSPDYRKFNCGLQLSYKGNTFKKSYENASRLEFKVSEFVPGFDLAKEDDVKVNIACADSYNLTISGAYSLRYDNTPPVLEKVYFSQGNHKYLPNKGQYMQYFSETGGVFIDRLVFDMGNTAEDGYRCNYQFISDDYICDDTLYEEVFSSSLYTSANINVLSDDDVSSICYKGPEFGARLDKFLNNEELLETKIDVHVKCFDNVGYATENMTFPLKIDYISGNAFLDLNVEYEHNKAIITARSISPFNDVGVYFDENANEYFAQLSLLPQRDDGLYVYKGEASLDRFSESGEAVYIWAIGFGEDSIWDTIRGELIVDKIAPLVELIIPDADEQNFVYSNEFEIVFESEDEGGANMGLVELYVNNEKVYDSFNLSNFKNGTILKPDSFTNYYLEDEHMHNGRVIMINGVIGNTYEIKVVSSDLAGNVNESSATITVKDGVGIRLLDSDSAFVDYGGFSWITKSDAPVVKFRTSRPVDECRLYPFKDSVWTSIVGDENADLIQQSILGDSAINNEFSFDLSSFAGYDLSVLKKSSTPVNIACKYNGTYYDFDRQLYVLNSLPDYVLTSSNGFILSEEPYETTLTIDSVGFYKHIRCTYTLNGDEYNFGARVDDKFAESINFRLLPVGSYPLTLQCENKLGTKGPLKTYNFIINKDVPTTLEDIKLKKKSREYDLDTQSQIYIRDTNDYTLTFKSNKKDASCEVEVDSRNGIFGNIVQFISNLFTDNTIGVSPSTKPYYFELAGLEFSEQGKNNLVISCEDMPDKNYEVYYLSGDEFDFELAVN